MPEPVTAPIEKAAWNCGITVRPIARSMRADSTLIGRLPSGMAMPLRKTPAARSAAEPTVGPIPMRT